MHTDIHNHIITCMHQHQYQHRTSTAQHSTSKVLYTHTHTPTHARTHARRHAGTQARRHAGTQARRHAGAQARRLAGTQARRHAGTQACRHAVTQARRHARTYDNLGLKHLKEGSAASLSCARCSLMRRPYSRTSSCFLADCEKSQAERTSAALPERLAESRKFSTQKAGYGAQRGSACYLETVLFTSLRSFPARTGKCSTETICS